MRMDIQGTDQPQGATAIVGQIEAAQPTSELRVET